MIVWDVSGDEIYSMATKDSHNMRFVLLLNYSREEGRS